MFINQAMAETDTITVQNSNDTTEQPPVLSSSLSSMVPIVLIFAVVYFLIMRPQEKRLQNQKKLIATVKKGEEVLTKSGMYGIVSKINDSDNTVLLKIANDVEIKILKESIVEILNRKTSTKDSKDKKTTKSIKATK